VHIFSRKSRTCRTQGSHQIRAFHCRSEQLIGREARREFEEALPHVLGAEASPEATLTITKHRPSRITITGLRCRPPPIEVSLIKFPRRCDPVGANHIGKDHRGSRKLKLRRAWAYAAPDRSQLPQPSDRWWTTEIRSRDNDSLGLIRAVDPVANDWHLMKPIDPWLDAGGPDPQSRGHILRISLKENKSANLENHWHLGILQKHRWTFPKLHFSPCNFTFRSPFNFL
jgi:hypothetical protein